MHDLRIVFMGTPEFAVGILNTIIKNNYNVVGVITAPDKPAGRGQKLKYSAVKEYALQAGLTLLQPINLKDESFLLQLKNLNANLQVVVAFRMLPQAVWQMPKLGTFNLHASLLPQYRGAAPINWAIINGETQTGVTTFFIDDKIDTGAIILSKETSISNNENAGHLHDRLITLGNEAVLETLQKIKTNTVIITIQNDDVNLKTAYKLNKENCKIDFSKTGKDIYNLIRGLSPYPGAWCYFCNDVEKWAVKIYEANYICQWHNYNIGQLISGKKELKIALMDGFLEIKTLQFPAKKKMTIQELLNGMNFDASFTVE